MLREPGADELSQRLMDRLGGLSPLVCREAALFAAGSVDARVSALDIPAVGEKLALFFGEHLLHPVPCYYAQADGTPKQYAFCPVRQYGPCQQAESFGAMLDGFYTLRDRKDAMRYYAQADGTPKQYAFCPVRQYGPCQQAESFGAMLDGFYTLRDRKDAMRQKSQAVRKTVQNLGTRIKRKLAIQEKELEATYDRERLRGTGRMPCGRKARRCAKPCRTWAPASSGSWPFRRRSWKLLTTGSGCVSWGTSSPPTSTVW